MDLYRFTGRISRKELLQSGKSNFSPLEIAVIIFESDNLLSEKQDAYRELLSNCPKMVLEYEGT